MNPTDKLELAWAAGFFDAVKPKTTKDKMKQYRQGDILLEAVADIPPTARSRKAGGGRIILAEGEATGHAHTVASAEARLHDDAGVTYLEVREALAMLTHEEHATIELPRGNYRVIRQREYSPEAPRPVAD